MNAGEATISHAASKKLNLFNSTNATVSGINASGVIVGKYLAANGNAYGFIGVPNAAPAVPESSPMTLILMELGLGRLMLAARRGIRVSWRAQAQDISKDRGILTLVCPFKRPADAGF